MKLPFYVFAALCCFCEISASAEVGRGRHDITGPAAEVVMMGYAKSDQVAEGILMRQFSRAFIVHDESTGKRIAMVVADVGQLFQSVQLAVLSRLRARFGELYTAENVTISATHTHSGAGGSSHYALFNFSTNGFIEQTYNTLVDGITQSIINAHEDLKPGAVYHTSGELNNANYNRSLPAYIRNPLGERSGQTANETRMTVLTFTQNKLPVGLLSWFPTHGTSMSNANRLLNGDNKGYASYLVEKRFQSDKFVAAFAQSSSGDMSPNTDDVRAKPDKQRMKIIGRRQAIKALSLMNNRNDSLNINGNLDFRQKYVDFSGVSVRPQFTGGSPRVTCSAALGNAFAAGTEDGDGFSWFSEGGVNDSWFVSRIPVPVFLDSALNNCHSPKPILLPVGAGTSDHGWVAEIISLSILKIGSFAVLSVPAEVTVMAGRRLINTVKNAMGGSVSHVEVTGLSNGYTQYVATREEYGAQHYEGASTLFGPWTLDAYRQEFSSLAMALKNKVPEAGVDPSPVNPASGQMTLQTGVIHDGHPAGKDFGTLSRQPRTRYQKNSTVVAQFWSGHPKNDLRINSSYLYVERKAGPHWKVVATDRDPETAFKWERVNLITATSKVTVYWEIPRNAVPGDYRIRHVGVAKKVVFIGQTALTPYTGISQTFEVLTVPSLFSAQQAITQIITL